jgi:hypothetical protein
LLKGLIFYGVFISVNDIRKTGLFPYILQILQGYEFLEKIDDKTQVQLTAQNAAPSLESQAVAGNMFHPTALQSFLQRSQPVGPLWSSLVVT